MSRETWRNDKRGGIGVPRFTVALSERAPSWQTSGHSGHAEIQVDACERSATIDIGEYGEKSSKRVLVSISADAAHALGEFLVARYGAKGQS